MKKFIILYFSIKLLIAPVFASNFDLSVDEEIRRNYNPSKLEEDAALPALPSILNSQQKEFRTPNPTSITQKMSIAKPSLQPVPNNLTKLQQRTAERNFATIKTGTKIKAKLLTSISERTRKGTKISFVSTYPVSTTYYTVPSGTVFYGKIENSHKPQLTGNGGLLVIKINSMILNNETQPISAYVTKVNHKKIFFNNIKGKRKYTKSVAKSLKPGYDFFTKMMRVTANLANDGSSIILTPFSISAGVLTFGANTIASPVFGLFRKGDSLSIISGSEFEFKLDQDVFIYN